MKILELKNELNIKSIIVDRLFLVNFGIIIFSLSFIIGAITKQCSIYYICSIVSAIILGWGVLADIKDIHLQVEVFIPFIKEELIENISYADSSNENVSEMLYILGKKNNLDTFVIINFNNSSNVPKIQIHYKVSDIIKKRLDEEIGEMNFIIIPLSNYSIGIIISVLDGLKK